MAALPERTDVAIIGAGFAGCATAWALAQRGIHAVVLEREPTLGRFSSGRGAGLGRQLAEDDATTRLTIAGAARLRSLGVPWRATGGLLSFDDPARAEVYLARAARHEVEVSPEPVARLRSIWPQLAVLPIEAAIRIPSDGVIDVEALLALYARDARIVHGVAVERVEPGGPGARVTTSRGTIDAEVVVDAAGAWAGAASGDPPLRAFKRHLFVVEATVPADVPYVWHLGRDEVYLRGHDLGMLACPCDETLEPAGDPAADPASLERMQQRLPGVELAVVRHWAGQRSFTADRQMRLGRDPDRRWLCWAAGLGGHGATASAAIGELVASAIAT